MLKEIFYMAFLGILGWGVLIVIAQACLYLEARRQLAKADLNKLRELEHKYEKLIEEAQTVIASANKVLDEYDLHSVDSHPYRQ